MTVAPIAVVVTVRDEAATIGELLESLAAQTVQPSEIVVVDGGSADGTLAILDEWRARLPLRTIARPGVNIAVGRNIGIAAATRQLIAVTDAGVRLEQHWLRRLYDAVTTAGVDVASGFFVADARTIFETAMGCAVLPTVGEIDPATFLPSSRSIAFRREAWSAVGGYPEWLDYCEDVVFDLALRESGARFTFVPDAVARFRPRGSLGAYWRQYYRYARGDGKADLFTKRHAIRYGVYASLICFVRRGWRVPLVWLVLPIAMASYLRRPVARLWPLLPQLSTLERLQAAALIPAIRLVGDLAKMAGYPVGILWRARHFGLRRDWRAINAATSRARDV